MYLRIIIYTTPVDDKKYIIIITEALFRFKYFLILVFKSEHHPGVYRSSSCPYMSVTPSAGLFFLSFLYHLMESKGRSAFVAFFFFIIYHIISLFLHVLYILSYLRVKHNYIIYNTPFCMR